MNWLAAKSCHFKGVGVHYYQFNPKNYMSKTSFLEPMEDLAYRRMLDHCYLTELPLPSDIDEIAILIRMRTHCDSIKTVLRYFFELTDSGYVNETVSKVIADYHSKSVKAKASADARWEKERMKRANVSNNNANVCKDDANAMRYECEGNANKEQETKNKEQILKTSISDVFIFWKSTFKKTDRTILKGVRETKIKARLNEGYSVDEIKQAILNISCSQYHIDAGHTDIELICRDQSHLDKYIAMAGVKKSIDSQPKPKAEDLKEVDGLW